MESRQNGSQTKSNHGYKLRRPGRVRSIITNADFVREPDETMLALARIKNNECLSWRQLADEYFPDYSHAYVRKVTLGEAQCDAISIALGVKVEPPAVEEVPVCPDCGQLHEQKATCPHELQKARKRPRRHRLHYECGHGESGRERKAAISSEMQALGCESFTQLVDVLLLDRKIRLGICPDCGNDKCMADGVHGLWCPACDASYLLERKRANE